MTESTLDAAIAWGNAHEDGAGRRGWFVGHFIDPAAGPAANPALEIKWGVHKTGETRSVEGVNPAAATVSILVSGRFRLDFPDHGISRLLLCPGDYAIWAAGVPHRWEVLEDAVILTVRWPSVP